MARSHARRGLALLAAFLCLAPLRPALAHAHLRSAQPAVDGTAHADVQNLRITYTEAVEARFCKVAVTGPDGQPVEAAEPQTDPADAKILVIHLPHKLAPGAYQVEWHATSVDTHKSEGKYGFSVAP